MAGHRKVVRAKTERTRKATKEKERKTAGGAKEAKQSPSTERTKVRKDKANFGKGASAGGGGKGDTYFA
eukprot:5886392-Amphidinium_carterae.1